MLPRGLVYVGHMLDTARKAVAKVRDLPRETYDTDETLRLALVHLVQVIGEAARQASREFTVGHPEIPWQNIIGMRLTVVHDYLGVDEGIVWQFARTLHARMPDPVSWLLIAEQQGRPVGYVSGDRHATFSAVTMTAIVGTDGTPSDIVFTKRWTPSAASTGRRKRFPEPTDVVLIRVRGLRETQRAEGNFRIRPRPVSPARSWLLSASRSGQRARPPAC